MPFFSSPVAAVPGIPTPHIYNWNPNTQFLNWRGLSGKVRNGVAGTRCPLAIFSDSTGAGRGGNGTATDTNVRNAKAWPAIMANLLGSVSGLPVSQQNFFSNSNLSNPDTRVVLNGSATYGGATMFGGGMINNGVAGDSVTFTPGGTANFDRVDVHYMDFGDAFTIQVGAQAAQTITPGSTQTPKLVTLSFTSAGPTTAITINMPTRSINPFISGLRCWNSTVPSIEVMNGSISGYTLNSAVNSAGNYSYIKSLVQLGPALTIIPMTINDATQDRTGAQVQADLASAVVALQAAKSDIILAIPTPTQEGTKPQLAFGTTLAPGPYTLAYQATAVQYNLPLVSFYDRYGPWSPINTAGLMFDNFHPNGNLYADLGAYMARLIGSL